MGRRYVVAALLALLFAILQTVLVPQLFTVLKQLDLLLALTVAYSLLLGPTAGALIGVGAGLLYGLLIGPALGFYAVALYITGYFVGQFSRIVFQNSLLVPVVVAFVSAASYWILLTLLTGGFYGFWIAGRFWLALPAYVLQNGLLTVTVYALLRKHLGAGKITGGR